MQSSSELYQVLKDHVNSDGLPIIQEGHFQVLTQKYGKDVFRDTLATFIATERPPFPLREISIHDMEDCFKQLRSEKHTKSLITDADVMEKFDDYQYPYSTHGLGVIDASSKFNLASNYFCQDLRLSCGSYGFRAPIEVWNNGTSKDIWKCLGPIWRGINGVSKDKDGNLINGSLQKSSYISAFRLGTYIATQFKPLVAKSIYEMTKATKVLDTSCGWGDRLCGFFASSATEYIGCDPNPNTYERYQQECVEYERILGFEGNPIVESNEKFFRSQGKKTVTIYRCGAEDLPWDTISGIDCAFTSPPYFSTEEYNKGGEHQEDQSWAKFNEYESWRDNFYLPVSRNSFNSLSENGVLAVNIFDPQIKGKRYRSSDELCNDPELNPYFIGQMGMRIMQRPQGRSKFKNEDGTFDKKQMDKFMKRTFIENIWCFSKNKDRKIFPQPSSLERFFS